MNTSPARSQRTYDHRLRDLVRTVGDPGTVAELGVPRTTALGWLRGECAPVVTAEVLDMDVTILQAEVFRLQRRVRMLAAIVRLLVALVQAFDVRLDRTRLPERAEKTRLLRAIDGTKVYLYAVIENFSRQILAWRVTDRFAVATTVATVRRLVAFYVAAHNTEIPHAVFRGQTPNETYYGRGSGVPERLEAAKARARTARLDANRLASCGICRNVSLVDQSTLVAA